MHTRTHRICPVNVTCCTVSVVNEFCGYKVEEEEEPASQTHLQGSLALPPILFNNRRADLAPSLRSAPTVPEHIRAVMLADCLTNSSGPFEWFDPPSMSPGSAHTLLNPTLFAALVLWQLKKWRMAIIMERRLLLYTARGAEGGRRRLLHHCQGN